MNEERCKPYFYLISFVSQSLWSIHELTNDWDQSEIAFRRHLQKALSLVDYKHCFIRYILEEFQRMSKWWGIVWNFVIDNKNDISLHLQNISMSIAVSISSLNLHHWKIPSFHWSLKMNKRTIFHLYKKAIRSTMDTHAENSCFGCETIIWSHFSCFWHFNGFQAHRLPAI